MFEAMFALIDAGIQQVAETNKELYQLLITLRVHFTRLELDEKFCQQYTEEDPVIAAWEATVRDFLLNCSIKLPSSADESKQDAVVDDSRLLAFLASCIDYSGSCSFAYALQTIITETIYQVPSDQLWQYKVFVNQFDKEFFESLIEVVQRFCDPQQEAKQNSSALIALLDMIINNDASFNRDEAIGLMWGILSEKNFQGSIVEKFIYTHFSPVEIRVTSQSYKQHLKIFLERLQTAGEHISDAIHAMLLGWVKNAKSAANPIVLPLSLSILQPLVESLPHSSIIAILLPLIEQDKVLTRECMLGLLLSIQFFEPLTMQQFLLVQQITFCHFTPLELTLYQQNHSILLGYFLRWLHQHHPIKKRLDVWQPIFKRDYEILLNQRLHSHLLGALDWDAKLMWIRTVAQLFSDMQSNRRRFCVVAKPSSRKRSGKRSSSGSLKLYAIDDAMCREERLVQDEHQDLQLVHLMLQKMFTRMPGQPRHKAIMMMWLFRMRGLLQPQQYERYITGYQTSFVTTINTQQVVTAEEVDSLKPLVESLSKFACVQTVLATINVGTSRQVFFGLIAAVSLLTPLKWLPLEARVGLLNHVSFPGDLLVDKETGAPLGSGWKALASILEQGLPGVQAYLLRCAKSQDDSITAQHLKRWNRAVCKSGYRAAKQVRSSRAAAAKQPRRAVKREPNANLLAMSSDGLRQLIQTISTLPVEAKKGLQDRLSRAQALLTNRQEELSEIKEALRTLDQHLDAVNTLDELGAFQDQLDEFDERYEQHVDASVFRQQLQNLLQKMSTRKSELKSHRKADRKVSDMIDALGLGLGSQSSDSDSEEEEEMGPVAAAMGWFSSSY